MRYYITYRLDGQHQHGDDYKIVKVLPADEANFLEDYGQYVLASGDSMAEALQNFNPPYME